MRKVILVRALTVCLIILAVGLFIYSEAVGYRSAKVTLQPKNEGNQYIYENGVLYRRAGFVPQLTVSGSHYQMGLQYGVLLRPEIEYTLISVERLLAIEAGERKVPLWLVKLYVGFQARRIASRLPSRFIDEIKGVSTGSGFPYQKILIADMIYDIFRLTGCTSVVWRSSDGTIYHGHNTDIGWGLSWPPTVIVKHNPTGYHSFTSITWAGFLGTQSAYNSEGLCYSENTLAAKKINSRGFSVNYLARMIMEECGSIPDVSSIFNRYGTIDGEALVLSDLKSGAIVETTPLSPGRARPHWSLIPMRGNALWGINLYQTPDFQERVQDRLRTNNGFNAGRLKILNHYFNTNPTSHCQIHPTSELAGSRFNQPKIYDLDHLIELMRTSNGPDGDDYAKNAYLSGVCNYSGLQMIVFSSQANARARGFYLATGNYYAARNEVQFYPDDFTICPGRYKSAAPLEKAVEKAARLMNTIAGGKRLYQSWCDLAKQYPKEAFIQAYTGWAALDIGNKKEWANRMQKTWELQPDFAEYQVWAACGTFYFHHYHQVIALLDPLEPEKLNSIKYKVLRLKLLDLSSQSRAHKQAKVYFKELNPLLTNDPELKHWLEKFMKTIK